MIRITIINVIIIDNNFINIITMKIIILMVRINKSFNLFLNRNTRIQIMKIMNMFIIVFILMFVIRIITIQSLHASYKEQHFQKLQKVIIIFVTISVL